MNKLELRLSGVDEGKYHVEAFVDGTTLVRDDTEEIDIPFALLPSVDHDGDYFFVTCECSDPGCAGYMTPTTVTREGSSIRWVDEVLGWDFAFDKEAYGEEVNRLIAEGRQNFAKEPPGFRRGEYLPNLELFRSESYEASLAPLWEQSQRNRREERLRHYLWEHDREEFKRLFGRGGAWRWVRGGIGCLLGIPLLILALPIFVGIWIVGALRNRSVTGEDREAWRQRRPRNGKH